MSQAPLPSGSSRPCDTDNLNPREHMSDSDGEDEPIRRAAGRAARHAAGRRVSDDEDDESELRGGEEHITEEEVDDDDDEVRRARAQRLGCEVRFI